MCINLCKQLNCCVLDTFPGISPAAALVYDDYNGMFYTRIGIVISGTTESAMPWVYCYLTVMLN